MAFKEAVQGGSGHSEKLCGPAFVAASFLQGFEDLLLVDFRSSSIADKHAGSGFEYGRRQMLRLNCIAPAFDEGILNYVLHFPAVARPLVGFQ